MKRHLLTSFVALAVLSAAPSGAWAQDEGQPVPVQGPGAEGPGPQGPQGPGGPDDAPVDTNDAQHGVARISVINGDVSVRRGDTGEVVAAALNAPLLSEDRLLTAASSRAEVQFDHYNLARLGANTELRMSDLQQKRFIVGLATGLIDYRMAGNSNATIEVDTPSVSVKPVQPGELRIAVLEDGTSQITVRAGQAEIFSPKGSQMLNAGQTLLARGSASDPEFQVTAAIPVDDWDRWNADRDRELDRSRSYQHVSADIDGAEDLDNSGDWQYSDPYGYVWRPRVAEGWAPYQEGRWDWEDYYGWNWVSYDPWGWAPYHYGRWFNDGLGWGWYPGAMGGFYSWSPALVGFFGFGGGFGFGVGFGGGFGFGNIGWCPLAPFEGFHPWWGRGMYGGYNNVNINRTNIVNNTNITNIYRNARVANGVTAMSSQNFGRTATMGNTVRVGSSQLQNASVVRGQLPVSPSAASTRMSDRAVNSRNFPQTGNRQLFAHTQPSPAQRIPFSQQQRGMQQVAQRAFNPSSAARGGAANTGAARNGAAQTGAARGGMAQNGAAARGGAAQTGALNNGRTGTAANAGSRTGAAQSGGWRQLGGSNSAAGGARTQAQTNTQTGRGPAAQSGGWRQMGGSNAATGGPQAAQRGAAGGGFASQGSRAAAGTSGAGGWQRFGQSQAARGGQAGGQAASGFRGTMQNQSNGSPSRGGWGSNANSAPRSSAGTGGWGHFSQPSSGYNQSQGGQSNGGSSRGWGGSSRGWAGSSSGWGGSSSGWGGNGGRAVQINPSIVQNRQSYSAPSSRSWGGGNSGGYSRPSSGGGGFSRPSGGSFGGGGGHSFGGGGGHSFGGGGGGHVGGGGGGGHFGGGGGGRR